MLTPTALKLCLESLKKGKLDNCLETIIAHSRTFTLLHWKALRLLGQLKGIEAAFHRGVLTTEQYDVRCNRITKATQSLLSLNGVMGRWRYWGLRLKLVLAVCILGGLVLWVIAEGCSHVERNLVENEPYLLRPDPKQERSLWNLKRLLFIPEQNEKTTLLIDYIIPYDLRNKLVFVEDTRWPIELVPIDGRIADTEQFFNNDGIAFGFEAEFTIAGGTYYELNLFFSKFDERVEYEKIFEGLRLRGITYDEEQDKDWRHFLVQDLGKKNLLLFSILSSILLLGMIALPALI